MKSTGLKGPKSALADVHDLDDYMKGGYFLEDLDIEQNAKQHDSPKSAHHAMGLEAAGYQSDGELNSPDKGQYGNTEEEQRKGLWRSIFGYFRGPKKQPQPELDSKSVKETNQKIEIIHNQD